MTCRASTRCLPRRRGSRTSALRRKSGYGREVCALALGRGRQHVDQLAALALPELHDAGRRGEERVVAAPPDVLAGVEARAALADDDPAGLHRLAVVQLHAEALGVGVTPVAGGTATLGLRHP